jgi:hypothetical protein
MPVMTATRLTEFLMLSDALKQCRGRDFESHHHPAVVFDRATGPSVRVWGWWTQDNPAIPCLLWCGERGWSATLVEPDELDGPGYELAFWSHRIKLLDLALANALGPHPTLGELELHVAADASLPLEQHGSRRREAMLWGIRQLRIARSQHHRRTPESPTPSDAETHGGRVDEELGRHALIPTLAKPRVHENRKHKDPAVDALVRALCNLRLGDHITDHVTEDQ